MPNPNAAAAGQPQEIPHPGINTTMRATNNLKLMCYYLRFKERTSRPVTAADITLDNVRSLRDHKEWEEAHDDVSEPELSFKDWTRTIEAIVECLHGCLGTSKIRARPKSPNPAPVLFAQQRRQQGGFGLQAGGAGAQQVPLGQLEGFEGGGPVVEPAQRLGGGFGGRRGGGQGGFQRRDRRRPARRVARPHGVGPGGAAQPGAGCAHGPQYAPLRRCHDVLPGTGNLAGR